MKRAVFLIVGAVVLVAVLYGLHVRSEHKSEAATAQTTAAAGDRAVPVRTAVVQVSDQPVYLDGLGSVAAYNTVTVRSQVDGRLDKVTFVEGLAVKKGEVLAQIDPRPFEIQLHQAQATLAKDTAQLKDAQLTLTRDTDLANKKLVPQQTVDDQTALVDEARAATQADEAQIETAKLNLDYARITSPIDGITGVRNVDVGNLVHAADATGIVVVTQLDPIAVLFTLPQDDLPQVIKYMQQGQLTAQAYSRDGLSLLGEGKLLLIDNEINANTATMRLKAVFDNPQHQMWPNQFVKLRLLITTKKAARTIPNAAVQTGPQGLFVYVVQPDSTVQSAPVKIDLVQADTAILASGLNGGETIVVDGQNQLRPGAKVSAKPSGDVSAGSTGSPDASSGQGGGHHGKNGGNGGSGGAHGPGNSDGGAAAHGVAAEANPAEPA